MKDFQEIIDVGHYSAHSAVNQETKEKKASLSSQMQEYLLKLLPFVSPFLLSIVTAPFTTASVLLQVTNKGLGNGLQAKIKAAPLLERHINNGIFGDNRIYQAANVQNYRDAFNKLGREGIRGLYKGNLTGILMAASNAWVRERLYTYSGEQGLMKDQKWSNILTVATCTFADFITLPLMAAQSRLILQNSSPHFRTYSSFVSVWRKTSPMLLFAGSSVLLFKNLFINLSWVKLIPESPAYSFIISTVASHILTFPFLTIIRQMQVSDPSAPMMKPRRQKTRECVRRIWSENGLRGFYRGFLAYGVVHLFMGALMVQANLRSGYFLQQ